MDKQTKEQQIERLCLAFYRVSQNIGIPMTFMLAELAAEQNGLLYKTKEGLVSSHYESEFRKLDRSFTHDSVIKIHAALAHGDEGRKQFVNTLFECSIVKEDMVSFIAREISKELNQYKWAPNRMLDTDTFSIANEFYQQILEITSDFNWSLVYSKVQSFSNSKERN